MKLRGLSRFALCLLMACSASRAEPAEAPWRKPGDRIDSILPMEVHLARFRMDRAEPGTLAGGAATREVLARRFLGAVARRDTAGLHELLVSRAEFAWLVFPDHRYARPPYELDPGIFWMQIGAASAKGLGRVLERLGGEQLGFEAIACGRDTLQITRGPVRAWSPCELRYRQGGRIRTGRLFGAVIEREGRFKLLSFANDF